MLLFYRPLYILLLAKNIKTPSGSLSILIDQGKNMDTTIIKRFTFFYDCDEIIRHLTNYGSGNKFIIIGNNCYSKKAKLFFGFDGLFSINKSSYILSLIYYGDDFSLNYIVISSRPYIYLKENNEKITKSLFDSFSYGSTASNILKKYFTNYNSYLAYIYNETLKSGYNLHIYKKKTDKFFIDNGKKYIKDFICGADNENSWNNFYVKDNIVFFDLKFNYVFFVTQSRIVSSFFTVNTIQYEMRFDQKVLPLDFLTLYVLENENSIIVIDRLDKTYFMSKLEKGVSMIQDKDLISMNIFKNVQLFTSSAEDTNTDIQIVESSFVDKSEWTYFYLENKNTQESKTVNSKEIILGLYSLTKTNIIVYDVENKIYQQFDILYLAVRTSVESTKEIKASSYTKYRAVYYIPDRIYVLRDIQCVGISPLFLAFIVGNDLINNFHRLMNKYIYNNRELNIKEYFSKKEFYLLTSPFYGPVRIVLDLTGLYISLSKLIELSKYVLEIEKEGNSYYLFHLDIIDYDDDVRIRKSGFKGNNNEESHLLLELKKLYEGGEQYFSMSIYSKSKYVIGKLLEIIDDDRDSFPLQISFFISKTEWLQLKERCESIYLTIIDGLFYMSNKVRIASLDDSARKIYEMKIMCAYGEHKVYFREAN